jgi:hypothetical protein
LDGDGMSVKDEKVDIHELTQSPVNRASQAEKGRPTRSYEGERESFLIEGVLFRARYLGSTQLISEGQPSKAMRMMQAQEAIGRIKQKLTKTTKYNHHTRKRRKTQTVQSQMT